MKKYTVILGYVNSPPDCYVEHVEADSMEQAAAAGLEAADRATCGNDFEVNFILLGHQDIEYRRDFDGDIKY